MENWSVGLDGNGNWSLLEGSLELVSRFLLNIVVGGDSDNTLGFVVLALEKTGLGGVWVFSLGLKWVLLGVGEGKIHHTTVATVVQP